MFTFVVKDIPTKFVLFAEQNVEASELYNALEMFVDDDDINDYNINKTVADILVNEGALETHYRSRNAFLYRKTAKFESFYDLFMAEYLGD